MTTDLQIGLTDRIGLTERLDQAAKRAIDLVLATLLLVLLSPVMVAIAIAIRLTSPGPALFRQVRVGHLRAPFVMLKFRQALDLDVDYAERRSVLLDLMTRLRTVPAVLRARGAG